MARIDFYHLKKQGLENVLPKLLEKAYQTGKRIKVKVGNAERVEFINSLLWTYDEESFLPHGSKKDGSTEKQPIFISAGDDNPNDSVFLFLVDGAEISTEEASNFERVFNIFDGNSNDSLEKARGFWKTLQPSSGELFYWQQDANGTWVQKSKD